MSLRLVSGQPRNAWLCWRQRSAVTASLASATTGLIALGAHALLSPVTATNVPMRSYRIGRYHLVWVFLSVRPLTFVGASSVGLLAALWWASQPLCILTASSPTRAPQMRRARHFGQGQVSTDTGTQMPTFCSDVADVKRPNLSYDVHHRTGHGLKCRPATVHGICLAI